MSTVEGLALPAPPANYAQASADRFLRENALLMATSSATSTAKQPSSPSSKRAATTVSDDEEECSRSKKPRNLNEEEEEEEVKLLAEDEMSAVVSSDDIAEKSAVVQQPPEEVAGFVRTLFTLLRVCDPSVVSWNEDGTSMLIHDPVRFAGEVCPKFFRHRNFNSFTRLLNMYQFHKVPGNGREKTVTFVHPSFVRNRDDLLPKIQRKGSAAEKKEEPEAAARRRREAAAERKEKLASSPNAAKTKKNDASGNKARRAPSIFPSAAHYRAAAGTPEALIGRDVWERTNAEITELEKRSGYLSQSTVGGSSAVSTWMRRVVDLEREARALKTENERLRGVEQEIEQLRAQVQAQNELMSQLQLIDTAFGGNGASVPAAAGQHQQQLPVDDASAHVDNGDLWRHVLGQSPAPTHQQPQDPQQILDNLPQDTQLLLRTILQQAAAGTTSPNEDEQHNLEKVKAESNNLGDFSSGNGAENFDATAAAMQFAMQMQQQSGVQQGGNKLDMTSLLSEPFTAQCMAQCLAMTGSLPTG